MSSQARQYIARQEPYPRLSNRLLNSDDQHESEQSRLWQADFPFAPSRFPIFYGWVIVAISTLAIIFSIPGQTMGFSVFTDVMMSQLDLSRVQLSTAYCIGTMLSGFTLPYLGRLFDRFGGRRMAVYSSLATGLVLILLSFVAPLARTLAAAAGGGATTRLVIAFSLITIGFYLIRAAAQGVLTMTSRNVIGKWFDYHRGTALALSGAVTAFAFSFAPRFLDSLITRFEYDGAWRLLGLLTITVMAGLGWLLFRDNPEECGMVMDGPPRPGTRRKPHADSLTHRDFPRAEALRTWPFWAFNLSFAFFALFATAYTFHIISIGAEAGRDKADILAYFVPMAVASVATNLFCGWISSRTRLKDLLLLMLTSGLAGVIGVLYVGSPPGAVAFVLGNGICGGCFGALSGIAWPRFFGRRWLGAISGVAMSSMVIASALGPIVFSLSLSWTGSYTPILWISATIPALLIAGSFRADNPQRKEPPINP